MYQGVALCVRTVHCPSYLTVAVCESGSVASLTTLPLWTFLAVLVMPVGGKWSRCFHYLFLLIYSKYSKLVPGLRWRFERSLHFLLFSEMFNCDMLTYQTHRKPKCRRPNRREHFSASLRLSTPSWAIRSGEASSGSALFPGVTKFLNVALKYAF